MTTTTTITLLLTFLITIISCPSTADTMSTGSALSFGVQLKARPPQDDAYCLGGAAIPQAAMGKRVKGFVPLVGSAAHHIMLFACSNAITSDNDHHHESDACSSGHDHHESPCDHGRIVYVWAHGGNPLYYPPNVGLVLGGPNGVQSFRVQVHFGSAVTEPDAFDYSGVRVVLEDDDNNNVGGTTPSAPWSVAEIHLLVPRMNWVLPPGKAEILIEEKAHQWPGFPFTVFAVRMHAHSRSQWNRVIVQRQGVELWNFKRSTKLPQSFYPLESFFTIQPGDLLDFGCMYETLNEQRTIAQGATKNDEMCNVYLYGFRPSSPPLVDTTTNTAVEKPSTGVVQFNPTIQHDTQVVGVDFDQLAQTLWTLSRGSRIWTGNTFDRFVARDNSLIKEPVLVSYGRQGSILKQKLGAGMFHMPHSVRFDPFDGEHVWVVDVGLHQVLKIHTESGKVVATFGTKFTPGSDDNTLCHPTDVAFSRDGSSIFISDGYCNNRVMELQTSDLKFVKSYTTPELNLPHALHTVKCDSSSDFLFVASRENGKLAILDLTKRTFLPDATTTRMFSGWEADIWKPYGLTTTPGTNRLVVGLVKRTGSQREGRIWMTTENICTVLTGGILRGGGGVKGEYVSSTTSLQEPHMLTMSDRGVYIAEAVDGSQTGGVWFLRTISET